MNKKRVAAVLLGLLMAQSCVLTSCKEATESSSEEKSQVSRPSYDIIGLNGEDPYTASNTTSTTTQAYATEDDSFTQEEYAKLVEQYTKQYEASQLYSLGVTSEDYVWTIVTLSGDSLIERYINAGKTGDFSSYLSTTGKSYRESMYVMQDNVKKLLTKMDSNIEYSYSYTLVQNGFAAKIKYGDLDKARKIAGIDSIQISEEYDAPDDEQSTLFASSTGDATETTANDHALAETDEYMGQGTLIAVLDTALDVSHPAFSGDCIDMSTAKVDTTYIDTVIGNTVASYWNNQGNTTDHDLSSDDVYVNNKVVYAYDYGNCDYSVSPKLPALVYHGTHTAGIAVGYDDGTSEYSAEDGSTFSGVAPYAQLAFMKVFYEDTYYNTVTSDDIYIAAAIEDCITLGVDVINLSLGSARGFSVDGSSANYIYTYCYYADLLGINVQAAVGNNFTGGYCGENGDYPMSDYPDYGSVNSPASYSSTLAVGSYDGENVLQYYAIANAGTSNECKVFYTEQDTYTDTTSTVYGINHFATDLNSSGDGTYQWVSIGGNGTYKDFVNAGAKGKIAFVKLNDTLSVNEQMANAMRSEAIAIVYVDSTYSATRSVSSTVSKALPYCGMSLLDYERMSANVSSGTIQFSTQLISYNLMSVFSSWGTTNTLTLKPEIVAVGGNVYSSMLTDLNSLSSAYTHGYGVLSGTSMAAPVVSAYAARLRQAYSTRYPDLTQTELAQLVNAVLMSTATQLYDLNGTLYSPRYQGAGAVNYTAAVNAESYLSVTGQNKPKIELGEDEDRTGVYVLSFNINNLSSSAKSYTISLDVLTDSLCADGKTVSLLAHVLKNYSMSEIKVSGGTKSGNVVTVPANGTATIAFELKLGEEDKQYLDENFRYGSYVEGYVYVKSDDENLSIPFLAFYGDWEESAMMDSSAYDEDAYLYATRLVASYYYGNSTVYLGLYPYEVPDGYDEIGYDADRLAIGSQSGGNLSLKYIYLGLLRNADTLTFNIFDKNTGEIYTSYTTEQVGKASYVESYGTMYPVVQQVSFGSSLPNNTVFTLSVRAGKDDLGTTINANDTVSFDITVDSEAPKFYTDSVGVYTKEDGSVWVSINVYDNNVLSCVSFYTYTSDGYVSLMDTPIPIDIKNDWKSGEKCTLEFEITDYVQDLESNILGIVLEDAARNSAAYRLTVTGDYVNTSTDTEAPAATGVTCDESVSIATNYSSDLGVTVYPTGASYYLVVDDSVENTGEVEIDNERNLVVARGAGTVRIKVVAGKYTATCDVYIYIVDGEWVYRLITTKSGNTIPLYDENGKSTADPAYAYDKNGGIAYYGVYAYRGEGSHVVVPSCYTDEGGDHPVVEIGSNAFYYCPNMYSVFIPKTILNIGYYQSFAECWYLTDVIFEEGSQLRCIAQMTFEDCYSLTSINIPASVVMVAGRAFYNDESLETLTFESLTEQTGSKLLTIGYSAFAGTALTEVTLPETVTSISTAFSGCAITKITLPEGLDSASANFANCTELKEVVLSSASTKISMNMFYGCSSLKKIAIPDGVTTIGSYAFYGCEALTSVVLPDSVTEIGSYAFSACTRLVSIRFGNGLQTIGNEAFVNDVSLRTVYFSEGTDPTSWGTDVFYGCVCFTEYTVSPRNQNYMSDDGILYHKMATGDTYELYSVPIGKQCDLIVIRPDVAVISDYAFAYHTELETVMFPQGGALTSIGKYAFAACTSLSVINLENADSLTSIGTYAFAYCTSLTSVSLPDSLKTLPSYAFYYCLYLKNCSFGKNLSTIGGMAFGYCIRFEGNAEGMTLVLPSTVSSIGDYAFLYNRLLKKVDMSACADLVDGLGTYAFEYCLSLREVVLPATLTRISTGAFAYCSDLESINLGDTALESVRSLAFQSCTSLKQVTLPETLKSIYSYGFAYSGLTSITIPSLGTNGSLMARAFQCCYDLVEINLPDDLTSLSAYTFAETAVKEVYIPSSISRYNLSEYAFYLCSRLERYIVDDDNPYFGTTEEGILYVKTYEEKYNGKTYYIPDTLFAVPINVQATVLDLTDTYTDDEDRMFDTISEGLFQYTTGIDTVIIPATIKTVDLAAFYYSSVKEVIFAEDSEVDWDPYDDYSIFTGCSQLETVVLPQKITCIPAYMFTGCTSLKSITLPESVTEIYDYAFNGCESLESINLENVEVIYELAFGYCTSLKEVKLGKYMRSLCNDVNSTVFEGCSSLVSVTVDPDNQYYCSIDGILFDKPCSVLYLYPANKEGSEYAVPEGVTKINELAFGFNQNLQKVILPKTLKIVGTFAFYEAEQLDTYVFLSQKAPTLEGQYTSYYGMVIYANFRDIYQLIEDDLHLVYPEGGEGYRTWLYQDGIFFADARTITDGENYTCPSLPEIAVWDKTVTDETVELSYKEQLLSYINELKEDALPRTVTLLDELYQQFLDEYELCFDFIEADDNNYGNQMVARYEKQADAILYSTVSFYAVSNARIYDLFRLMTQLKAKNEYGQDALDAFDTAAYYIQYYMLNADSTDEVESLYEYYVEHLNSIPTKGQEATLKAAIEQGLASLKETFESVDATLYSEKAYAFILNAYNGTSMDDESEETEEAEKTDETTEKEDEAASGYISTVTRAQSVAEVNRAVSDFKAVVDGVAKLSEEADFEAYKQEQLARLDVFREDNYEHTLWLLIDDYINGTDGIKAAVDECFLRSDVKEIVDNAYQIIANQTSKFSVNQSKLVSLIDTLVENYNMYFNLYDEQQKQLTVLVGNAKAAIEDATTEAGIREAYDNAVSEIWAFYEYNQKAYVEYRKAIAAFETLSGEVKQQAMKELEALSYRVATNADAIAALVAKYVGEVR